MSKRWLFLLLVLAASGATFAWVRLASHDTPAGQPPLAHLSSATLASLKDDFNRAAADARIIVLLSPT